MSDVQVVPPFAGATFRRRGRVYTAPTTDSIAMPLADAAIAEGHGWQVVAGWYAPKETAGGGASPAGSNGDVQVKSGSGFAALGFTPLANTAAAIEAALVGANLTVSADYTNLGAQTYSQPTFSPAHDKWDASVDLSFVGNVPTYVATGAGNGYLYQAPADLAAPMVTGRSYRFSWTLQNVTAGDLIATITGDAALGVVSIANGTNHFDFIFFGTEPAWVSIVGTTGEFEIVSVSLKAASGGILSTSALNAAALNGLPVGLGGGDIATNIALGLGALAANTVGAENVATGFHALNVNVDGNASTAVGSVSLENNLGSYNSAFGTASLRQNTTGHRNTASGVHGHFDNLTGSHNITIGFDAGNGAPLQSGNSHNIIIGPELVAPIDVADGQMTIGNLIYGTGLGATLKTVSTGKVGIKVADPAYDFDVNGTVRATAYRVGAVAGIDFSGPVTSITVVKGIVTAAS